MEYRFSKIKSAPILDELVKDETSLSNIFSLNARKSGLKNSSTFWLSVIPDFINVSKLGIRSGLPLEGCEDFKKVPYR